MPKLKTHSSTKKRFRVTGNGNVKVKQAHTRHRLISKPKQMKRKARGMRLISGSDIMRVLTNLLPYSKKRRMRTLRNEATAKANDNNKEA